MKAKNEKTEKGMEMKNNHSISTFFDAIFSSATKVRTTILDDAAHNIKAAQKKQKRDYYRRHMSKTEIKVDDIVLLKNNKRFDRKNEKFSQKWLGPYTVMNISDKELRL